MGRRPEPLWPTTSALEWDAKGPRAVRALIALLSSNVGCEVSGMARFWAGRIAVTEHIPGLSAHECRLRARGRREGHQRRVRVLGGPFRSAPPPAAISTLTWLPRRVVGRDRGRTHEEPAGHPPTARGSRPPGASAGLAAQPSRAALATAAATATPGPAAGSGRPPSAARRSDDVAGLPGVG
jgi:hypothetical protein